MASTQEGSAAKGMREEVEALKEEKKELEAMVEQGASPADRDSISRLEIQLAKQDAQILQLTAGHSHVKDLAEQDQKAMEAKVGRYRAESEELHHDLEKALNKLQTTKRQLEEAEAAREEAEAAVRKMQQRAGVLTFRWDTRRPRSASSRRPRVHDAVALSS